MDYSMILRKSVEAAATFFIQSNKAINNEMTIDLVSKNLDLYLIEGYTQMYIYYFTLELSN